MLTMITFVQRNYDDLGDIFLGGFSVFSKFSASGMYAFRNLVEENAIENTKSQCLSFLLFHKLCQCLD